MDLIGAFPSVAGAVSCVPRCVRSSRLHEVGTSAARLFGKSKFILALPIRS